jgi:hypothetical protein
MASKHLLFGLMFLTVFSLNCCVQSPDQGSFSNASWKYIFQNDGSYLTEYQKLNLPEESFTGLFSYVDCYGPENESNTLMRCTPYKLGDQSVYAGSNDLKECVGKRAEVIGKKYSFELEGQQLTEIWPVRIRCA